MSETPNTGAGDGLSPADAAALRMLAGAHFGPNAKLILPSGRTLTPAEAQAFTSAYAPAAGEGGQLAGAVEEPSAHDTVLGRSDDPLSSEHDRWTGDPETDRLSLVARALAAIHLRKT